MASFDIVSKIDLQEIDNTVNSIMRELGNRYDFKGAKFSAELNSKENLITLSAEDEYKIGQIRESLKAFGTKRGIDPKVFDFQKEEPASGNSVRQIVKLRNGVDQEIAKKIVKQIKGTKIKVQGSIRGDEVRVEGKKLDDLQEIMSLIKSSDYDIPLQFINYR